jgi:hypothetical protein
VRKGLMVTGNFPCIRVGKTTEALGYRGWEHDVFCMHQPPQLRDVYKSITEVRSATDTEVADFIRASDAEIIHIHNEPNWPVLVAKDATKKPVILNVHDAACARPLSMRDPFEFDAYESADALIFVTEAQRDYVLDSGARIEDTPYTVIGNYATSRYFVDKPILPHVGGVVYEGGIDARGAKERWRDQSVIADALQADGVPFHIFSDTDVDYGTPHGAVVEFSALTHQISRFDWGFCGVPEAIPAWSQSIPNKFFDYLSGGIPVIAYNCEPVREFCDAGFGIYADSIEDILRAAHTDPKPYRKHVLENRGQYTFLRHIDPVVELYNSLGA